jgi:hypothetical protein
MEDRKSHWLPVDNPKHTEVLGSRVSGKYGRHSWDELDWSNWWMDGPERHMFNGGGGMYFHVPVRKGHDNEGAVYRVRCWYAGTMYRGRKVESVGIGFKDGRLHWIVRTIGKERPILIAPEMTDEPPGKEPTHEAGEG